MYGALLAFDYDFIHVVSISFSALIVTELIMVAMTVHTWHWAMLIAQVCFYYSIDTFNHVYISGFIIKFICSIFAYIG